MEKVSTLNKVIKLSNKLKSEGKSVGLVLGSFDVLHLGHINLFRFAKKHCDYLIVGLDNDKTIKITKGMSRPVNNYKKRSDFLSEIGLIDYIFKIESVFKSGDSKSFRDVSIMLKRVKPTHFFSSINCDHLWTEKKKIADKLGIKFIPDKSKKVTHTSEILKKLMNEV